MGHLRWFLLKKIRKFLRVGLGWNCRQRPKEWEPSLESVDHPDFLWTPERTLKFGAIINTHLTEERILCHAVKGSLRRVRLNIIVPRPQCGLGVHMQKDKATLG